MATLASISEAEASPELDALYRDIRETLGAPAVNLIWRHLASVEGALPWVWKRIRPLFLDPFLECCADGLRELALGEARAAGAEAWRRAELAKAQVDADDLATIRRVLLNYHSTNPGNLIALLALRRGMSFEIDEAERDRRHRPEPAESGAIPRPPPLPELIAPQQMDSATHLSALRLEALARSARPEQVVAGVPRHLAHWPRFLELVVDGLSAREAALFDTLPKLEAAAARAADCIELGVRVVDLPPFAPFVTAALELFTSRDMITAYIAKVAFTLACLPE